MTTTESIVDEGVTNGNLPPIREGLVAQAERVHQEIMHERDELRKLVRELESKIAGYKVGMEAQQAQLAEMESRLTSAYLVRDEKVTEAAESRAVLRSIAAQMRAFDIEAEPLVREKPEPVFDGS